VNLESTQSVFRICYITVKRFQTWKIEGQNLQNF